MSGVTPINWQNLFLGDHHFYRDLVFPEAFLNLPFDSWLFCLRTFNDPQTLYLLFEAALGGGDGRWSHPKHPMGRSWMRWICLLLLGNSYYVLREMMITVSWSCSLFLKKGDLHGLFQRKKFYGSEKHAAYYGAGPRQTRHWLLQHRCDNWQLTQSLKKREREIEETSVLGLHLVAKQQQ